MKEKEKKKNFKFILFSSQSGLPNLLPSGFETGSGISPLTSFIKYFLFELNKIKIFTL
jgi:hypothetical protein